MTDYAKHIEGLQIINTRILPPDAQEALNTAIELVRAATPKDAEAERAECDALEDLLLYTPKNEYSGVIANTRAAARAEGYAQQEDSIRKCETAIAEEMCETSRLSVQLSAAQAEIERLRGNLKTVEDSYCELGSSRDYYLGRFTDLGTKLTERDAEIERLQADYANAADGRAHFKTKLTEREAEIERLRNENTSLAFERDTHMEAQQSRLADVHTAGVQSLTKQLTERDSEIERLRGEVAGMRLDFDLISREHTTKVQELNDEANQLEAAEYALTTKLTNLRAAAERAEQQLRVCGEWPVQSQIMGVADDVKAAIEASR